MATNITAAKLKFNEASPVPENTQLGADGIKIPFTGVDDSRVLIVIKNLLSDPNTITIKAGSFIQGTNDLEIELEPETTYGITVESGKYMNADGHVYITGISAYIYAIVLP